MTLRVWAPVTLVLCAEAQTRSIPVDYQAFFSAEQALVSGNFAEVLTAEQAVNATRPESPLRGKVAILAARALLASGKPADALASLRRAEAQLPQPEGDALSGEAAEAAGQLVPAAGFWQNVYYKYPRSPQAGLAGDALQRLRSTLGNNYPECMPAAVFERAETLRRSGEAARARTELQLAARNFAGLDRELALVRAATGDYGSLAALTTKHAEADAERLYLMHAVSRRNSQFSTAEAAMRSLDAKYPPSAWTMEALTSWGNHWLIRNDADQFLPPYRTCAERFNNDYCQWKVAWHGWISRRSDARAGLQAYLTKFPDGDKAATALYFLERYPELAARFPMSWYAVLARQKTGKAAAPTAKVDPVLWTPTSTTRIRIGRARDLESAGLPEWAEFELRYAAGEQPYAAAAELAALTAARGEHDKGLRYIKGLAKDYLRFPLHAAPQSFWRLAFPFPWRRELEEVSRVREIDPFLMAALIRQESEFNPKAISRARAYGLTQVLPSTGRQISRHAGVRNFSPAMLFQPDVSLKLGAYHLRSMLNAHSDKVELTLASYNAGKSRTDQWITWYDYREPAEFVETIPFSETRTYVQAVLRNAYVYRSLYGKQGTRAGAVAYGVSGE